MSETILYCDKSASCRRINGHSGSCTKPPISTFNPHMSLMKWCMRRTKFKAYEVMSQEQLEGNVDRAGCNCVCEICGENYIDHPQIEEHPELHVICDWRIYKL